MYRRILGNVLIVLVCLTAATFYVLEFRILPTSSPDNLTHSLAGTSVINSQDKQDPATLEITETSLPTTASSIQQFQDLKCPTATTTLSLTTTAQCTCPTTLRSTPYSHLASPSSEIPTREQEIIARLHAAGIIVVFKTGAQEISQLAIQLGTTLRYLQPRDILFFSDLQGSLGPFIINDALRNVDQDMKTSDPDFEIYRQIRRFQSTGQDIRELTEESSKGDARSGWKLDKYKFIHMVEETFEERPNAKWYVFIETDSYVFWDNLVSFLERFDSSMPMYLGSAVVMGDVTFAHGGSGYVLSNAAMIRLLGPEQPQGLAASWDTRMKGFCCGDVALATALQEKGVLITVANPLLNGDKPTTFMYGDFGGHWCQPAVTMHHILPHEISAVWRYERRRELQDNLNTTTFADLYAQFVEPHLTDSRENWDNLSHGPTFTEPSVEEKQAAKERLEMEKAKYEEEERKKAEEAKSEEIPQNAEEEVKEAQHEDLEDVHQDRQEKQKPNGKLAHGDVLAEVNLVAETQEEVRKKKEEQNPNPGSKAQRQENTEKKLHKRQRIPPTAEPWESIQHCRNKCESEEECFQYVYIDTSRKVCKLGMSFRLGKHVPPSKDGNVAWTSGWLVSRIRQWTKDHACNAPEWPHIKPT